MYHTLLSNNEVKIMTNDDILPIKEAVRRLREDVKRMKAREKEELDRELNELDDVLGIQPEVVERILKAYKKRMLRAIEKEIAVNDASMVYADYEEGLERGEAYEEGLTKASDIIDLVPIKVNPDQCKNCGHLIVKSSGRIFHGQVFPTLQPHDYRCVCGCREPDEDIW